LGSAGSHIGWTRLSSRGRIPVFRDLRATSEDA
jgi:hypothetical protein